MGFSVAAEAVPYGTSMKSSGRSPPQICHVVSRKYHGFLGALLSSTDFVDPPSQADRASLLMSGATHRAPRPDEEYITTLKKGVGLFKYGRRGKPHAVHVRLSDDLTRLIWTSKKAKSRDGQRELPMQCVTAVEAGQGTRVFKRFPSHAEYAPRSFSILYNKKCGPSLTYVNGFSDRQFPKDIVCYRSSGTPRSLDLVCASADDYELWFVGLHSVHSGLLTMPKPTTETGKMGSPSKKLQASPSASEQEKSTTEARKSKSTASSIPPKDFIGDVYVWGSPSGSMSSARSSTATTNEGLQESFVPVMVHDTHRLNVVAVACGPRHAAMITKSGETYTWGSGDAGRLGHGDCQSATAPKMVLELSGRGVVQLACGDWHTAAVTRDGSLYTWGDGTAGILGHGTPHRQWSPKRVERPLQGVIFTFVASGPYHTAAVSKTGDLYTWGDGFGGKLGHGGMETCLQPRKVEKLSGHRVTSVAAGVWHTVCLTLEVDNSGADESGSIKHVTSGEGSIDGIEPTAAGEHAARVNSLSTQHSSVTHGRNSSRLRSRGLVWAWGGGDKGCLGLGDDEGRHLPEKVTAAPESVRQIVAGLHFTAMLSAGGKVWLTGSTAASSFDGMTIPAWEGNLVPKRVRGALSGLVATQIAAGMHHIAVIAAPPYENTTRLYTWGRGTEGQLGHGPALPGTSPSCPEPRIVKQLEGRRLIQVACGGCNTMAVVEHDAEANRKYYETVTKELDDSHSMKMQTGPVPPPGLLVGSNALMGTGRGPSSLGPGSGRASERRMSKGPGSFVGEVAHSFASGLGHRRGPDSEVGGPAPSHHSRASHQGSLRASASVLASSSYLFSAHGSIPSVFICPITQEVFEDPVVAADGYTYERYAIVRWLREKTSSPMSGLPLDHTSLTPNHSLRSAIEEWRHVNRRDAPSGASRHRYAPSFGGESSHGSQNGLAGGFTHSAAGFHGAMILPNPMALTESNQSTPMSSEPSRAIGQRL